ncbi:AT-rich interactive domain-containing protein 2-like [Helicoverpa armigera]|uniref:AT-rich interactive domain-containing protein 2-like n=1 Tax=Helicoverpa armigera TaxID=29058 RepID=UPI003082B94B
MDVEKQHDKLGCPLFITLALLTMIPLSTGYIDCRISCRRCHENTEHPSVLEVYCAMCEECKQRRRERMANRTPSRRMTPTTAAQLVRMRDGVSNSAEARGKYVQISGSKASTAQSITEQDLTQTSKPVQSPPVLHVHQHPKLAQRNAYYGQMDSGYPAGCPTPPMCESEEQILVYPSPPPIMPSMPSMPASTTTTTTTTTQPTQPPCPPVHTCRKKKPSMHGMSCMPCMPMCPCPMYPYPPQQQQLQQLQQPQQPQQPQAVLNQPTTAASSQAGQDYHYLYVGLPKNVFNTN